MIWCLSVKRLNKYFGWNVILCATWAFPRVLYKCSAVRRHWNPGVTFTLITHQRIKINQIYKLLSSRGFVWCRPNHIEFSNNWMPAILYVCVFLYVFSCMYITFRMYIFLCVCPLACMPFCMFQYVCIIAENGVKLLLRQLATTYQ